MATYTPIPSFDLGLAPWKLRTPDDSFSGELQAGADTYEQQVLTQLQEGMQPLVPKVAVPGLPKISGALNSILGAARRYLGIPYRWGGTDPRTGLDCSGYVQRVFADLGIRLPRTARQQSGVGMRVRSLDEAQIGDLVFFGGGRSDHIGIYAGNGMYYEAPHTGDFVKLAPMTRTPTVIRRVM